MNIEKLEKETFDIKDINCFLESKYPNLEHIISWDEKSLEDKFIVVSELSIYEDNKDDEYLLVVNSEYFKGSLYGSGDQLYTFIKHKNLFELFEELPNEIKRKEFLEKIYKDRNYLTNSDFISYIRWYNNKFQSL